MYRINLYTKGRVDSSGTDSGEQEKYWELVFKGTTGIIAGMGRWYQIQGSRCWICYLNICIIIKMFVSFVVKRYTSVSDLHI